jgi:hypothetical protein
MPHNFMVWQRFLITSREIVCDWVAGSAGDGLGFFGLGSETTAEVSAAAWRTNGTNPELTAELSNLMDALVGLLAFPCRDNIPDLTRCPAMADGTISLCGGGITTAVTSCFATGSLIEAHSIFKPCCCQGGTSDELLFVGANMTSMRNSK